VDLFNPEKAVEFVGAGHARDPLNRGHGPLLHTGFQFAPKAGNPLSAKADVELTPPE
jgi:hypothetical protein